MRTGRVVDYGGGRLRIGTWRADAGCAHLAPLHGSPPPAVEAVRRCVEDLELGGAHAIVTSALSESEQEPFLDAGFHVLERLHLLVHELDLMPDLEIPPVDTGLDLEIRRARQRDRRAILDVDARAFDGFWVFDDIQLRDALAATPNTRFRAARHPDVVGYCIVGRARRQGFIQRLAVEPAHQRCGVGAALLADGLWWLRRRRVERVVVNTQVSNAAAVSLYERFGFLRQSQGLAVLGWPDPTP